MNQTRKNFIKNQEDFVCENCDTKVSGTGYTNHCPKCLYSKHVDIIPGDRANTCNGLMPPTQVEYQSGEYILTHKCLKCGFIKRNHVAPEDDFDAIVKLSQEFRV